MEVTVRKDELLTILRDNRAAHRDIFEKAVEAYTRQLVRWHRDQARRILKGQKGERMVALPVPEDHTDDYDNVIEMLEMDISDTFTLDSYEFQNYVRDRWNWSGAFAANTASYLAK